MRWHSLVELIEHDNSAASTMVHGMYMELYIRLYLHVSSSSHTLRDEWWTAAAAEQVRPPLAARSRSRVSGTNTGAPTRLRFLHAGRRANRRLNRFILKEEEREGWGLP